MAVTDFSLAHTPGGSEVFGGVMIPDPASSVGDTLQSTGVAGAPAEWAAPGGSIPSQWDVNADGDLNIQDTGDAEGGQEVLTLGTVGGLTEAHKFDNFGTWYGQSALLSGQTGDFALTTLLKVSPTADNAMAVEVQDETGTDVFQVTGDGRIGFFSVAGSDAAVAQPAAPTTLEELITALQDLGLIGT